MDVDTSQRTENGSKVLHLGWLQVISLVFSVAFGGLVAYLCGTWWTLCGAAAGVVLSQVVVPVGNWMLSRQVVLTLRASLASVIYRCSRTIVANSPLSPENVQSFEEGCSLFRMLWAILKRHNLSCANTIIVCGLLKSPLKYLSWGVVGLIVSHIFFHGVPGTFQEVGHTLREIDPSIGLFFLLAALQNSLRDRESEALFDCQNTVTDAIERELLSIHSIEGMRMFESRLQVARYLREFREHSYRVGRFAVNGCRLLEGLFNMIVLLGVLAAISTMGALLATVAVVAMAIVRFVDLRMLRAMEESSVVVRAERNAAARLAEDPTAQVLITAVAWPERLHTYLLSRRSRVRAVQELMRAPRSQRLLVGRAVFFTLFATSALRPVWLAMQGEMQARVAMLYFFSLLGLWGAMHWSAERASQLVESLDDLPTLKEALELLVKVHGTQSGAPEQAPQEAAPVQEAGVTEIRFAGTRFHYPFRGRLLRFLGALTSPATVSTATVCAVLGPPRSGTSTVLQLIAGHLVPSQADLESHVSVSVGNLSTAEHDLWDRVLLISDKVPQFDGFKVGELFRALCGAEYPDCEIRAALRRFDLLDEIEVEGDEFSGLNLLIGAKGRILSEEQRRTLNYALTAAVMEQRLAEDGGFNPAVIAIDGISKLLTLERRLKVQRYFRTLADELHATLVVVVRDERELEEEHFVFTIVPKDLVDINRLEDGDSFVVIGGEHGRRLHSHDERKASQYKSYLSSLRGLY